MLTAQEALKKNGIDYVSSRKDSYTTRCPNCAGGYLNVKLERDGVVWYCHNCQQGGGEKYEEHTRKAASDLGAPKAIYDYTDETGVRLFQALRFEPRHGVKDFRQRIGPEQTKWSIKGVRIVPYRLPELIDDIRRGNVIHIVEGEKDVNMLRSHGVAATCNPMGAGKWWSEFNEILRGADVVICGDHDQPGRDHVALVLKNLRGVARRVRVLDLATVWPEIQPSDDVSDWFAAGHTVEQFRQIVQKNSDSGPGVDREQGVVLLEQIEAFLRRFVSYPSDHAPVAHVLWIAHTHLMAAWESTPRLAFLSPEPGSGKTRSMEVTELLVPDPVAVVNCTPAFIFRKCGEEGGPPTILFDEIDTVFGAKAKEHEELRALLNSGHRRGAMAGRCVVRGKTVETEEIPSYAAVALAGLGWLPDTILSRSIIIRMRRRAPDERVEPFRRRVHAPLGEHLRKQLAGWAAAVVDEATDARPEMPVGVEDRNADCWEALLAVAEIAGGDWPERARKAAVDLVKVATQEAEPSMNVRLLADLRTVFGEYHESLTTKKIIGDLCVIDDAPWGDLKGKPLTDAQLARRLRQYGVKSKTIRVGDSTPRGYTRADLHDAWRRYLPPLPGKPATGATPATSQEDQRVGVAPEKTGGATPPGEPQQPHLNVAPVAAADEACCAPSSAKNPCESTLVAHVAGVAPLRRDGDDLGLSSRAIDQIVREVEDWAHERREDPDLNELVEPEVRRRLAGMVLPETIGIEAARVLRCLFGARS